MICPFKNSWSFPTGFKTFRDALLCGTEIYHALRARLEPKVSEAEGLCVIPTWSKYELAADTVGIISVIVDYSEIETSEFRV